MSNLDFDAIASSLPRARAGSRDDTNGLLCTAAECIARGEPLRADLAEFIAGKLEDIGRGGKPELVLYGKPKRGAKVAMEKGVAIAEYILVMHDQLGLGKHKLEGGAIYKAAWHFKVGETTAERALYTWGALAAANLEGPASAHLAPCGYRAFPYAHMFAKRCPRKSERK